VKLSAKKYKELLPTIENLHAKGAAIYCHKELEQLKVDWKGLSPVMVIVDHNKVELVTLSKDSKIIRHSFYRLVGVWSPKAVIWWVNYHTLGKKEQIQINGSCTMSDEGYRKHRLDLDYVESIAK